MLNTEEILIKIMQLLDFDMKEIKLKQSSEKNRFFTNEKNRKYVANTLVEVIIKDKEILTTREILNYIYDIVVAQNFNHKKIAQSLTNEVSFLKEYIYKTVNKLFSDIWL